MPSTKTQKSDMIILVKLSKLYLNVRMTFVFTKIVSGFLQKVRKISTLDYVFENR